jgi:hypothetical protein
MADYTTLKTRWIANYPRDASPPRFFCSRSDPLLSLGSDDDQELLHRGLGVLEAACIPFLPNLPGDESKEGISALPVVPMLAFSESPPPNND